MGIRQSEAERVYELRRPQRLMALVILPFFVVVGVLVLRSSLRDGSVPGTVFAAVWMVGAVYQGWYALRRMPTAIGVAGDGVRFVARGGTVAVPWGDLESVRPSRWDLSRQTWVWRWRGGKLRSFSQYEGAHRLLADVERHAPHAEVTP